MDARTSILANGAPPSHPAAVAAFRAARRLVCCDGAYPKALALGRDPDLVVGDGDSLTAEQKAKLGERFIHIAEQDTNDLDKAFRTVSARFRVEDGIVILGAGGLREDHFLGNVFRLPGFAQVAPNVEMVTDAGVFSVVTDRRVYACRPGEAVSVFASEPETHVRSLGLEWPLDGVSLAALWQGTLNRTTGESFTLWSDRPLIVYRPHS